MIQLLTVVVVGLFVNSPTVHMVINEEISRIHPYDRYFKEAGENYCIDWQLLKAIAIHESGKQMRADTVHDNGRGIGPMALLNCHWYGINPRDPHQNIMRGTQYFAKCLYTARKCGYKDKSTIINALYAYNRGIERHFKVYRYASHTPNEEYPTLVLIVYNKVLNDTLVNRLIDYFNHPKTKRRLCE